MIPGSTETSAPGRGVESGGRGRGGRPEEQELPIFRHLSISKIIENMAYNTLL